MTNAECRIALRLFIRNSHFGVRTSAGPSSRSGSVGANVAFDDEVGLPCRSFARRQALGKTVFNSGKMFSGLRPTWGKKTESGQKPAESTLYPWSCQPKINNSEPDAKAILPEPRSVEKIAYGLRNRPRQTVFHNIRLSQHSDHEHGNMCLKTHFII